jgi:predicted nucleic acid-binding protein
MATRQNGPKVDPTAPRLFLDASVIISGLISSRGGSHAILVLAELGFFRPVVCPYILTETERNLNKKVPELLPSFQQIMTKLVWEVVPDPSHEALATWLSVVAPKDAPVLVAAINAGVKRLVTLDAAHFLRSNSVQDQVNLRIQAPGDVLRELRSVIAQHF